MSDSVVYADGQHKVTLTSGAVVFTTQEPNGDEVDIMVLSRAAFREIVSGWERELAQERDREVTPCERRWATRGGA